MTQVQTEKVKLIHKCASSSDPPAAYRLVSLLGVAVGKTLKMADLPVPDYVCAWDR